VASGGGEGRLVAADLLIFIRMLIFLNAVTPGFRLFVKALLAVIRFVCVLASYRQLAKILFPPLFFPFSCLNF
jgi:hypothetical protein